MPSLSKSPHAAPAEEAAHSQAGFLGDVFKLTVAKIPIQHVSAKPGHVQVLPAVVVKVRYGDAHSPTLSRESGGSGNIAEFQIRVLMIERHHQVAALAKAIHGRPIHGDDVELAVVVAIDESNPTTHRLDNGLFPRSGEMRNIQSGRRRDILKPDLLGGFRTGIWVWLLSDEAMSTSAASQSTPQHRSCGLPCTPYSLWAVPHGTHLRMSAGESKEVAIDFDPEYLSIFNVERDVWQLIPGGH